MDRGEVIDIVRNYKKEISDRFRDAKVYLYGSYSKGYARPESDIDVAVIVPTIDGNWLDQSASLWKACRKINVLIEPVLIAEDRPSPLYEDVLRTGIAV